MTISKKNSLIAFVAIGLLISIYFIFFSGTYFSESKNEYVVSIPHYGPLITTQSINVKYTGNIAVGFLPESKIGKIKSGKKVVLFDKENYALPLGGEVRSIERAKDNSYKVVILVPKGTKTDLLGNILAIIKREEIGTKRLPNTALQRDENGELYVWRAIQNKNSDRFSIEKTPIQILFKNEKYFVEAGQAIGSKDFVILNPDNTLAEEKTYEFEVETFTAPLHNPIKQAWIDYKLNKDRKQQAELKQIAENCANGVVSPSAVDPNSIQAGDNSSNNGSSCGSPFQGTDPFLIFQDMIQQYQESP